MAPRKKLAHRILGACVQHARILSFLLYLAAIVSYLALPVFVKRNYLDENALLAGFAHSKIRFVNNLNCLYKKLSSTKQQPPIMLLCRYSSMLPGVTDAFRSVSELEQDPQVLARKLLTSMQVKYWESPAHFPACNASTLHSILHAPRGDGKEALVLVTPVNGEQPQDGLAMPCAVQNTRSIKPVICRI